VVDSSRSWKGQKAEEWFPEAGKLVISSKGERKGLIIRSASALIPQPAVRPSDGVCLRIQETLFGRRKKGELNIGTLFEVFQLVSRLIQKKSPTEPSRPRGQPKNKKGRLVIIYACRRRCCTRNFERRIDKTGGQQGIGTRVFLERS